MGAWLYDIEIKEKISWNLIKCGINGQTLKGRLNNKLKNCVPQKDTINKIKNKI